MAPGIRIQDCNHAPIKPAGSYVLYWIIANRRLTYNFALERALEHCRELRKPLMIFEALRCDYQWASDRLHRFVIDGMADNANTCAKHRIRYFPYVEPEVDAGKGLLEALASHACVLVTDDFPCFFLPRMVGAAARKLSMRLEAVDTNGLMPIRAADRVFVRAFDFRRYLQKVLPSHLANFPMADPLAGTGSMASPSLPRGITSRWPPAFGSLLQAKAGLLDVFPIDHQINPVELRGGHTAAHARIKKVLTEKLSTYGEEHNAPEVQGTSNMSPYLHFGHISAHEIFAAVARLEKWRPQKLALRSNGARQGWWNMSGSSESYLNQLVTWREVGYNFCAHREDYDRYDSLPTWAQKTLEEHAGDGRPNVYSLQEFETGATHDPLWNAAQGQLVRDGYIHNYLRMLWGKKILEWSDSPQTALSVLIHLNNKYSVDGRNPNSYSGIFWCLGRYDRAWGPIRPIYWKIRYMSSENTARKYSVKNYIQKYTQPNERR